MDIVMTSSVSNQPIIVLSGPSGSGKTTMCRRLAEDKNLYYSISHTSRPRRHKEIESKDYFFVSPEEFKRMIDSESLIEWAEVYGNYYGTSRDVIESNLKTHRGVILDLDTQGAAQIKKIFPGALSIFIKVPNLEELQSRLNKRGRDSAEEIQKRIANAKSEMDHLREYDQVVINDDLERSIQEVAEIVENHLAGAAQ